MSDFYKKHQKVFDLKKFVADALHEDVGDGDHTSLATIPSTALGQMRLLAKEDGIIAGVDAAKMILREISASVKMKVLIPDGTPIKKGDIIFTVKGPVQKLLLAERMVLNVMQRMSGIATKTHHLQQLCKGTRAKVIDTRKTTPGFRFFEKWAVVIGGGANHRYGLYDMILIKDNHVDFCGGIIEAIKAAKSYLKRTGKKIPVEVETRNLADVKRVLEEGGIKRIMLDNYNPEQTAKAVSLINRKFEVESSGGITEKNIARYAKTGVDFISIGALTHHVKSLDLSLKAM
jgi:nicotinate-nucleotide pyrophosphorylase (carboxylating)